MSDRLKPSLCPGCGYVIDGATHPIEKGTRPSEGDLSICINCGLPLKFQADLTLIKAEDSDIEQLEPSVRRVWDMMIRAHKKLVMTRGDGKLLHPERTIQ